MSMTFVWRILFPTPYFSTRRKSNSSTDNGNNEQNDKDQSRYCDHTFIIFDHAIASQESYNKDFATGSDD